MRRIVLAAVLALGLASRADAATATANLAVSATVNRVCTIGTATLAFPNYEPQAGVPLTSQSLSVKCNKGYAPTVAIDSGTNFANNTRRMANGGEYLEYALSLRSSGSTGNSVTAAAADASGTVAISVEGSIPAGQWVPAAATPYTDTVVMTVTF